MLFRSTNNAAINIRNNTNLTLTLVNAGTGTVDLQANGSLINGGTPSVIANGAALTAGHLARIGSQAKACDDH